jgi:hypothetical protein
MKLSEKQQIEIIVFLGWCSVIIEEADYIHQKLQSPQINPNIIRNRAKQLAEAIEYVINKFYHLDKPKKTIQNANPELYAKLNEIYQNAIKEKDLLTNQMMDFNIILSNMSQIATQVILMNEDKKISFQDKFNALLKEFDIEPENYLK